MNSIICIDSLEYMKSMSEQSVNLIITSPPYYNLRQYGNETVGREESPYDYINNLLNFTEEMKRILINEGSCYINLGDVYYGSKGYSRNTGSWKRKTCEHYINNKTPKEDGKYLQHKQLLLLPERLAIGMQEQGWILRNKIIWQKLNPLPVMANDRVMPTYENIYFFSKKKRYYFNKEMSKKIGWTKDIVTLPVKKFQGHEASFSENLIEPFILVSSKVNDVVFDPFAGSGTTLVVAKKHGRKYLGCEINEEYIKLSQERLINTKIIFSLLNVE